MQTFFDTVTDVFGNSIAGATVTVTNYPNGGLATLFQDTAGTIPQTNPFTTGSLGTILFAAANGQYFINVVASTVAAQPVRVLTLFDVNDDPDTGVLAKLALPSGAGLVGTLDGTVQSDISALQTSVGAQSSSFAPIQNTPPAMNILVGAGRSIWTAGQSPVVNTQQTSATIVAPLALPRIDRVVVDGLTGVISVVTGTENASPVAPAIPEGKFPCAQILLQTSTTSIVTNMITDERAVSRVFQPALFNKSGAYTLVGDDQGQVISFTGSSSVAFTLTAPATLGAQWSAYVKNAGTAAAVVTLTPASGTIDGLATLALNPGDVRLILCDGANFTTIILSKNSQSGLLLSVQYITSTQSVAAVPGAANYDVIVVGGGASGAGASGASLVCAGGGPGGIARKLISATTWGSSQTVTIGAAGAAASNSVGNGGGTTSVGSIFSATGGLVATATGTAGLNGQSGAGVGGDEIGSGFLGSPLVASTRSGAGGGSNYGIGGAPVVAVGNNGNVGTGYGSGGSGGYTPNLSGAISGGGGAPGVAIIRAYS